MNTQIENPMPQYTTRLFEILATMKTDDVEFSVDPSTGTWRVDFQGGMTVWATPFYEGALGLPIDLCDEEGSAEFVMELPFEMGTSFQDDATNYLRLIRSIPGLLRMKQGNA